MLRGHITTSHGPTVHGCRARWRPGAQPCIVSALGAAAIREAAHSSGSAIIGREPIGTLLLLVLLLQELPSPVQRREFHTRFALQCPQSLVDIPTGQAAGCPQLCVKQLALALSAVLGQWERVQELANRPGRTLITQRRISGDQPL